MLVQGLGVEAEIRLQTIRNLGIVRGEFSAPHPDIFTPSPEKDPVPIVQESGWASGPVWTDPEYFTFTSIRSPNLPGLSELLCRPNVWIYNAK
jgi:hypothetical protein